MGPGHTAATKPSHGPIMDPMDMANYPTRSSTPSLATRALYARHRPPPDPEQFTSAKLRARGISTAQPKVAKGTMVRMPITTMNNAPQVTPAARSGSTHPAIQIYGFSTYPNNCGGGNWNYCENGKHFKGGYDNGRIMSLQIYMHIQ